LLAKRLKNENDDAKTQSPRSEMNKKDIEKDAREVMQSLNRCWPGYEPVPGKKPYSPGSCRPMSKSITQRRLEMLDDENTVGTEEPVKENIKNGTHV
jgi:hypothetical protein